MAVESPTCVVACRPVGCCGVPRCVRRVLRLGSRTPWSRASRVEREETARMKMRRTPAHVVGSQACRKRIRCGSARTRCPMAVSCATRSTRKAAVSCMRRVRSEAEKPRRCSPTRRDRPCRGRCKEHHTDRAPGFRSRGTRGVPVRRFGRSQPGSGDAVTIRSVARRCVAVGGACFDRGGRDTARTGSRPGFRYIAPRCTLLTLADLARAPAGLPSGTFSRGVPNNRVRVSAEPYDQAPVAAVGISHAGVALTDGVGFESCRA